MDETQASGAGMPTVESLQAQLEEERRKAESFYGSWQRSAADFANFKRRTEQERSEAAKMAGAMAIMKLLPAVDDLERALGHAGESGASALVGGVEMVRNALLTALRSNGVERIEAAGKPFDPAEHEAVTMVETADSPPNTVVAEFRAGYRIRDRLLRAAMVSVSKAPAAS